MVASGVDPIAYGIDAMFDDEAYQAWLTEERERDSVREAALLEALRDLPDAPTISVAVPVYRPELELLDACISSVRAQVYPGWELCLCDDGSGDAAVTAYLERVAAEDTRIRWSASPENRGIAAATNGALDLATGELVAFLDQDDELHRHALAEVAVAVAADDAIDVVYTDEDKLDLGGRRTAPVLKPAWSPDFLLSIAYLTHLLVVRRELVDAVGRLRPEYDGSQDFDLMLRVTERARRIAHVARVLYHWRTAEGSVAHAPSAKPWAYDAGQRAVEAALGRRGIAGSVEKADVPGFLHVRRAVAPELAVSVVVDGNGAGPWLRRCLDSIAERGGCADWQALVLEDANPGTYGAMRNEAARRARGNAILFLDGSAEGVSRDWLRALLEQAQRPEVGAVGARLVRPSGRLLHAGVAIGLCGDAGRVFDGCPPTWRGYFCFDGVVRNWSAVDGACLMAPREAFEDVGGFDEVLDESLAAVDLCLRLGAAGRLVVYTPHAEVVVKRPRPIGLAVGEPPPAWVGLLQRGDPFFHPSLSLSRPELRLDARPGAAAARDPVRVKQGVPALEATRG